eukprot:m.16866 g.16866  ORF g.16866 m.16866 type:complete len:419 (-) comp5829_c0_seq1:67-1323(-)
MALQKLVSCRLTIPALKGSLNIYRHSIQSSLPLCSVLTRSKSSFIHISGETSANHPNFVQSEPSDVGEVNSDIEFVERDFLNVSENVDVLEKAADISMVIDPALRIVQKGELAAAGLASWWPSGLAGNLIETISVQAALPWAGGIIGATVLLRGLLFPLGVKNTRNAVKLYNLFPQTKLHMDRMNRCKESGDEQGQHEAMTNLNTLYSREKAHPFFGIAFLFVQMPVFLSMFWVLRSMASHPIESMKYGGLDTAWWHALNLPTDLTIPDPTYILPAFSAVSMALLFRFGADAAAKNALLESPAFFLGLPAVIFGVTVQAEFPAAVFLYWSTSNVFSLTQALALNRITPVKRLFDIPDRLEHDIKPEDPFSKLKEQFRKAQNIAEEEKKAQEKKQKAVSQKQQKRPVKKSGFLSKQKKH